MAEDVGFYRPAHEGTLYHATFIHLAPRIIEEGLVSGRPAGIFTTTSAERSKQALYMAEGIPRSDMRVIEIDASGLPLIYEPSILPSIIAEDIASFADQEGFPKIARQLRKVSDGDLRTLERDGYFQDTRIIEQSRIEPNRLSLVE